MILVALCLAVDVLFLTVQVQRLTKERDAALALRDDANDAMRRMAEERVFARVRSSVVSWVQPGSPALDALSNEAAASRVKPQQAKRRPRGSVTEAIRAAAVVPVKAGEIAAKTGIDQQQLAVMLAKMARLGALVRVGVGLYQRADCLETAAQPKPAPVDVHEFASAQ